MPPTEANNLLLITFICSCRASNWLFGGVFNAISEAYSHAIPPNPLSAISGIPPDTSGPVAMRQALAFIVLLAQRLILLNGKLSAPNTCHLYRDDSNNPKSSDSRSKTLPGSFQEIVTSVTKLVPLILLFLFFRSLKIKNSSLRFECS